MGKKYIKLRNHHENKYIEYFHHLKKVHATPLVNIHTPTDTAPGDIRTAVFY